MQATPPLQGVPTLLRTDFQNRSKSRTVQGPALDTFQPSPIISLQASNPTLLAMLRFGARLKDSEKEALASFKKLVATLCNLGSAGALLHWDQATGSLPPKAVEASSRQSATLATISHEKLVSPEMGQLLAKLQDPAVIRKLSKLDKALVREWGDAHEDAVKLPASLVEERSVLHAKSYTLWEKAKQNSRYPDYKDTLRQVVEKEIEATRLYGETDGSLYNTLLDSYEQSTTMAKLDPLFADLRRELLPLVQQIQQAPKENFAFLDKRVDAQKVEAFCKNVLKDMGFDFRRGRMAKSAHPFMTGIDSPTDVRVTVWGTSKRPTMREALETLFAAMHEGGHALFELGASNKLARTNLAGSSLGIHESQSRLWENQVGRGRPFWEHYYPKLQALFPKQLGKVSLDEFYRGINQVKASPIRVEADEVTYNLHIMVRYEIEKALIENNGNLPALMEKLPEMWNQKMQEYLGITPANDREGVLQDVHWTDGGFGYFPTYTIGTLFSAQLYDKAKEEIPDLEAQFAKGNMKPLRKWLQQQIHKDGAIYQPEEIIQRSTGKPLDAKHFVNYLWDKYSNIYPGIQRPGQA
jgi:carboxypeptidase Taq